MKYRNEELYEELRVVSKEILPYYIIDKIKPYGVFIWTRDIDEDLEKYVFDIYEDEIVFYVEDHKIIEEAKPIIEKIQIAIKNLREYTEKCK